MALLFRKSSDGSYAAYDGASRLPLCHVRAIGHGFWRASDGEWSVLGRTYVIAAGVFAARHGRVAVMD